MVAVPSVSLAMQVPQLPASQENGGAMPARRADSRMVSPGRAAMVALLPSNWIVTCAWSSAAAVAVSLATKNHDAKHYETAARAAVEIVARLKADPLPADTILNVNVPDMAWADVRGFEVTRLGNRHRSEPCVPQPDPRGHTVYWIGPAGPEQDAGPGTDFHAVRMGYISITPIHVDLTRYQALEKVAGWVGGLTAALEASA